MYRHFLTKSHLNINTYIRLITYQKAKFSRIVNVKKKIISSTETETKGIVIYY